MVYTDIKIWMKGIEQHASQGVNKILVGNKADMDDKRVRLKPAASFVNGNHEVSSGCMSFSAVRL